MKICFLISVLLELLRYRMNSMKGGNTDIQCWQCGRKYKIISSLRRHLRLECGKEPQFQCPFCPHKTKLKSNLTQHMRYKHRNQDDHIFSLSSIN